MISILIQKYIKPLIKGIFVIFVLFLVLEISFGNYDRFLDDLKKSGIEVDGILESNQINRYELSRLLNTVTCQDCVNTPTWMIEKYTNNWRLDFSSLPGKDFDDIVFGSSYYNGKPYYYCVAYVGDNSWMRGYPQGVSPVCNGKFCGYRNTTIGEFLQVVLNISDQYVYNKYLANRGQIKKWMDGLTQQSYPDTYLNQNDKDLINKYAQDGLSGILPNKESLQPYLKYCMFNLAKCGMQSFGSIKQGYWPIGELNILYDHNIVEHEKFKDGQVHELVSGEYVLKTLYNVFEIVDCNFDDDYDCDNIPNAEDNCPNHYNPSQKDTDGDGLGDVCDPDIDGDGILNPIGIVDDLGNVVVSKWKAGMDNCLFVKNPDQKDSDSKGIGDACKENQSNLGMYIKSNFVSSNAPLTVNFEAITEGLIKGEISRDFGDGNRSIGHKVTNTFLREGIYKIQANAIGINNEANAITTLVVGKNAIENDSMQISVSKLGGSIPTEIKFTAETKGHFDKFEWNFGENNIVERNSNETITKIFKTQGSYMITLKGIKNNKIISTANVIVAIGENGEIGSHLKANNTTVKKEQTILLETNVFGFNENDISSIERNMGNGEIIKNRLLDIEYIYKKAGTHVIVQKIILKNGKELQNFLTINIRDDSIENSYAINADVSKLILSIFDPIRFDVNRIGILPEVILLANKYGDLNGNKDTESLTIWPKKFEHKYIKEGVYFPKNTIFLKGNISLDNISTVVVSKNDICMNAKLNGTLNQFKCDMDGDGIPDICDDDIDGDGMPNLIGLIDFELDDCSITSKNINKEVLLLHNDVCTLDNCPFHINPDQMDINNNGRGDMCDNFIKNLLNDDLGGDGNDDLGGDGNNGDGDGSGDDKDFIDSDGDGIPDHLDACPTIPENYNGIEDSDGCPEIDIDGEIDDSGISVKECFSCPCDYSDFANDLNIKDRVKAILWDFDMTTIYSETIPESIRQFLK
ncbi:MAG: thrombospondin type 3 repeat-containing protein [Candidatus Absconditabacterales bacterium]|nr:thrombospondin type 3 repeat-containing protein [Candidatus Absconditabacterales bacterium]